MSTLSILPYFLFQRVRITKQTVFSDAEISQLTAVPDERFHPICHVWQQSTAHLSSRQTSFAGYESWFCSRMDKLFVS
ncbi:MAG: hypothetical protein HS132_15130 [Planctomycetia bacterium]|nr:hypothetical protein [Planctomycetia bacterium]